MSDINMTFHVKISNGNGKYAETTYTVPKWLKTLYIYRNRADLHSIINND